jgi:hypothetical protein
MAPYSTATPTTSSSVASIAVRGLVVLAKTEGDRELSKNKESQPSLSHSNPPPDEKLVDAFMPTALAAASDRALASPAPAEPGGKL